MKNIENYVIYDKILNNKMEKKKMDKFKIFSSKSWMESNAISQMKSTSEMDGVLRVSGMPDMHVGKYGPNGCSVLSENLSRP